MFKPHVTVACVVHAQDKFLIVEETINGKALWNQPAGHLEANETLLQAALLPAAALLAYALLFFGLASWKFKSE